MYKKYFEHTALLQLEVVIRLLHSCNRDRKEGLLHIGQVLLRPAGKEKYIILKRKTSLKILT